MPKILDRSAVGNRRYWGSFVSAPCVAVSVRRAVWSVQLTLAGWRRQGGDREINNTCERFIESSFNACLKMMFRENRLTHVTQFLDGSGV